MSAQLHQPARPTTFNTQRERCKVVSLVLRPLTWFTEVVQSGVPNSRQFILLSWVLIQNHRPTMVKKIKLQLSHKGIRFW